MASKIAYKWILHFKNNSTRTPMSPLNLKMLKAVWCLNYSASNGKCCFVNNQTASKLINLSILNPWKCSPNSPSNLQFKLGK
jgi:hypothetical protein